MGDVTLLEIERLRDAVDASDSTDVTFAMDEEAFRAFYDRTARSVWAYLSRATGDQRLADDLLQDTYYRFLRAGEKFETDAHRRHYLFRIAINLVRDHQRRSRFARLAAQQRADDAAVASVGEDIAARTVRQIDVKRAMGRLRPRERDLLWLAYAVGSTHEEIAATLGLKAASIKSLLFRARRRLAAFLGRPGAGSTQERFRRGD
jgi:RNA polymerase sigma-70 factor (ECF subfamily)